jgi:hypothetical protein
VRVPVIPVACAAVARAVLAVAVLAAAGCTGGDPNPAAPTTKGPDTKGPDTKGPDTKGRAEAMIAGDLATAVGLGPLVPSCNEPGPLAVGAAFTCTAARTTQPPGEPIQVEASVLSNGHLNLVTRNLVSAAALPSFERRAAAQLNESSGTNFTADSVDCGNTAVVLPVTATLECALIMPASGEVFDLTLTITDLDARNFALVVGANPRSPAPTAAG